MGCLLALPWYRNLAQAAQIGLLTLPSVFLSVVLLSRQRQQIITQRTAALRLQFQRLRSQTRAMYQTLNQTLHQQDRQTWGLQQQAYDLQTHVQQWQQDLVDQHQQCQEYEQYLAALDQQCRHYKAAAVELARTLAQRQQLAQALETEIAYKQTQFHKLTSRYEQLQRQHQQTQQAGQAAQVELQRLQAELQTQVGQQRSNQAELVQQIPELEQRWETLKIEAVSKEIVVHQLQQQTQELEEQHSFLSNQVAELNELLAQKQSLFEQVDRTLAAHQQACHLQERHLQQLETNIAALRSERIEQEQELIAESSQWSILSLGESLFPQEWQTNFQDNPHLEVLRHIEAHGVLTEAEAASLLGNPRLARQFANKLGEYARFLPFAIRVEASPTGNRYLKETKH
jgi:chromosome segregation ATPase